MTQATGGSAITSVAGPACVNAVLMLSEVRA